jgi:hypothetical protein
MAALLMADMLGPVAEGRLLIMVRGGGRRAMQQQEAGAGGHPSSPASPPDRPYRDLVRLVPVLTGAVMLALLAAGLMLYGHVTRLDRELDTATTQLHALRGQQARAEHRISDLADDVRDIGVTLDRNAARELDTAKVIAEAQDAVFTIYTTRAQGTALCGRTLVVG